MIAEQSLLEQTLPGAWPWSHVLKRGKSLKIRALGPYANVGMMAYAAWNFSERYNMADSLKAQHISAYSVGNVLYSDMGRILLSLTESSLGRHDALGGMMNKEQAEQKYGKRSYADYHNNYIRNGYDSFLGELNKYGMTKSSLISSVNWFSCLDFSTEGAMQFCENFANEGDYLVLRAEMDTLILLHSCPHPLNPSPKYRAADVQLSIFPSLPAGPRDLCRTSCEENIRGFIRTEAWHI